jgi:hypothetical protein
MQSHIARSALASFRAAWPLNPTRGSPGSRFFFRTSGTSVILAHAMGHHVVQLLDAERVLPDEPLLEVVLQVCADHRPGRAGLPQAKDAFIGLHLHQGLAVVFQLECLERCNPHGAP